MKGVGGQIVTFHVLVVLCLALSQSMSAQANTPGEMLQIWMYESSEDFSQVDISADGKYVGAATSDTGLLYLFGEGHLLWTHYVGETNSIAMSRDGKHIAVGAVDTFFLFNREASEPKLEYQKDFESSLVAISYNGDYIAVGAFSSGNQTNSESQLYLFENGHGFPSWVSTLEGKLESLSMSELGNHIIAATSLPGRLYVYNFNQNTPEWTYDFGQRSGGAKISANGDYVVAVGGDMDPANLSHWPRVFQFLTCNGSFTYQKLVPELPPHDRLAVSQNGSIFTLNYNSESTLMLFDMNVKPYGPSSIRNFSIPARVFALSMSPSGRYVFLGADNGLSVFKYSNSSLTLWKQYTASTPSIYAISASESGYTVALARRKTLGDEYASIYLFDIFQESPEQNLLTYWQLWAAVTAVIILSGAAIVLLDKRKMLSRTCFKKEKLAVA